MELLKSDCFYIINNYLTIDDIYNNKLISKSFYEFNKRIISIFWKKIYEKNFGKRDSSNYLTLCKRELVLPNSSKKGDIVIFTLYKNIYKKYQKQYLRLIGLSTIINASNKINSKYYIVDYNHKTRIAKYISTYKLLFCAFYNITCETSYFMVYSDMDKEINNDNDNDYDYNNHTITKEKLMLKGFHSLDDDNELYYGFDECCKISVYDNLIFDFSKFDYKIKNKMNLLFHLKKYEINLCMLVNNVNNLTVNDYKYDKEIKLIG